MNTLRFQAEIRVSTHSLFCAAHCRMNRVARLMDAQLPPPTPCVGHFLTILEQWREKKSNPVVPMVDPVHGEVLEPQKPSGSTATEKAGVSSVLNFAAYCKSIPATYPTVDALYVAWGRWVVHPKQLFQDEADHPPRYGSWACNGCLFSPPNLE